MKTAIKSAAYDTISKSLAEIGWDAYPLPEKKPTQLIIAPTLSFGPTYVQYLWTMHFDELIIFVLLMCAELITLIDSLELVEE